MSRRCMRPSGNRATPRTKQAGSRPLARLEEAHRRLERALGALTGAGLERFIPGEPRTYRQMVAGLVEHDAYQAGQIVLLRRLQGAWPPEE